MSLRTRSSSLGKVWFLSFGAGLEFAPFSRAPPLTERLRGPATVLETDAGGEGRSQGSTRSFEFTVTLLIACTSVVSR